MINSRLTKYGRIGTILFFALWIYSGISWCVNVYQLLHCNFDQPWKDEIVHILGLFPPLCWFTIWI